jgi:hypothetical protein
MGVGDRVHREHAREALPDDLRAEFQDLSDWVHRLIERYRGSIKVRIIDAASIEGVWKSLRHRVRKYPTVVVDGRFKQIGTNFPALEPLIEERVHARGEEGPGTQ